MDREWQRLLLVTASAIAGMAMLGCAVVAVALMRGGQFNVTALAIGAVLGGIAGFSTLPWIIAWLWDTRLHRSLPFVYGIALLLTLGWAALAPPVMILSAAMPAVICTLLVSAYAQRRFHDPKRNSPKRPLCPDCEYDLTGLMEPGCPECGWGRPGDTISP